MKKKTILLVEDDELDVMSVRRSLKTLDIPHELHTAINGVEAFKLLKGTTESPILERLPDIILLDLHMPLMNGLEFLSILRADEDLKDIRVYLMMTSGDLTAPVAPDDLGVSGYLIKPTEYGSGYNRVDSMEHFMQFHLRNILLDIEER